MTSPTVPLTDSQEARLQAADADVQAAFQEVERWLRAAAAERSAEMPPEHRARYEAAKRRLRGLIDARDALRARFVRERTIELRRRELAAMVATQEIAHHVAARAAEEHARPRGVAGVVRRLFGR